MPTAYAGTLGTATGKPLTQTPSPQRPVQKVPTPFSGTGGAPYRGSLVTRPTTLQKSGQSIGRLGTRAAAQDVAEWNAQREAELASASQSNPIQQSVNNLNRLASIYNQTAQLHRDTALQSGSLFSDVTNYYRALAETQLPENASQEIKLLQQMVRSPSVSPSNAELQFQRDYFGNTLETQDTMDFPYYSPLMHNYGGYGYGAGTWNPDDRVFQRDYVQRLLDAGLIPSRPGDQLADDAIPTGVPQTVADAQGRVLANNPGTANLKFMGQDKSVQRNWYNPRSLGNNYSNMYYDVFGDRAANSAWYWRAEDDQHLDLQLPDAPYVMQGYGNRWNGGTLDPAKESVSGPTRVRGQRSLAEESPIAPQAGQRQVFNANQQVKIAEGPEQTVSSGGTIPLTGWAKAAESPLMNPDIARGRPAFMNPPNNSGGYQVVAASRPEAFSQFGYSDIYEPYAYATTPGAYDSTDFGRVGLSAASDITDVRQSTPVSGFANDPNAASVTFSPPGGQRSGRLFGNAPALSYNGSPRSDGFSIYPYYADRNQRLQLGLPE